MTGSLKVSIMLVLFPCRVMPKTTKNLCSKIIFFHIFSCKYYIVNIQNDIIELHGYENVGVDTKIIILCQIEMKKSPISFFYGGHFELSF